MLFELQNQDGQDKNELTSISHYINSMNTAISSLTDSLNDFVKTEIELGMKKRECDNKDSDITEMKKKFKVLTVRYEAIKNDNDVYKRKNKALEAQLTEFMKDMGTQKRMASEKEKKLETLEKRLEFMLDIDLPKNLNSQDKLRVTLNEVMKENELLKKQTSSKSKENDRLNEKMKKLEAQIMILKKKVFGKNRGDDFSSPKKNFGFHGGQALIKSDVVHEIPDTLNFRIQGLKNEYISKFLLISDLLNEVEDEGAISFSHAILKKSDLITKREEIALVASQYISFKEFASKQNQLIYEISNLFKCLDKKALIKEVSRKLPNLFNCERANLWILESV